MRSEVGVELFDRNHVPVYNCSRSNVANRTPAIVGVLRNEPSPVSFLDDDEDNFKFKVILEMLELSVDQFLETLLDGSKFNPLDVEEETLLDGSKFNPLDVEELCIRDPVTVDNHLLWKAAILLSIASVEMREHLSDLSDHLEHLSDLSDHLEHLSDLSDQGFFVRSQ